MSNQQQQQQHQQAVTPTGAVVRQEFGATEVQRNQYETSAMALAVREKATIQAFFVMAVERPRDVLQFEHALLKECERPGFAEVARYKKPQKQRDPETDQWKDGFVEGWSIRFAEAAMRSWRNVYIDAKIVFEDPEKRIVRFVCIDLENNIPLSAEIQLAKTVERSRVYDGQEIIGERVNSKGRKVYIVPATEDQLQQKQAVLWSKFIRNVLRFMPGDVLDAAEVQIAKTLKGQSPEAAWKRIVENFDRLNVTVADLQVYLGHSLSQVTEAELNDLRGIYTALKEGETWLAIMDAKTPSGGSRQAQQDAAERQIAELQERQRQRAADTQEQNTDHPAGDALASRPAERQDLSSSDVQPGPAGANSAASEESQQVQPHPPSRPPHGLVILNGFPENFEDLWINVNGKIYYRWDDGTGPTYVKYDAPQRQTTTPGPIPVQSPAASQQQQPSTPVTSGTANRPRPNFGGPRNA